MRRAIAGSIAASLVAVVVGACGNNAGGPDGGPDLTGFCSQFTTCGTCTPQNGCGWCYDSDGTGTCAADPDECSTPAFSWTWDPDGCRVAADASVVPEPAPSSAPEAGADQGPAIPVEAGALDAIAPVEASSYVPPLVHSMPD
jgi:hypothetical protein